MLLAFSARDGKLLPLELWGCTEINIVLDCHTTRRPKITQWAHNSVSKPRQHPSHACAANLLLSPTCTPYGGTPPVQPQNIRHTTKQSLEWHQSIKGMYGCAILQPSGKCLSPEEFGEAAGVCESLDALNDGVVESLGHAVELWGVMQCQLLHCSHHCKVLVEGTTKVFLATIRL